MLEYLFNSDTNEIISCVSEWAQRDEPALRAQCVEVSRHADTSSLTVQKGCIAKGNATKATLRAMGKILQELSKALSVGQSVFGVQSGKEYFPAACRAIIKIEEERQELLSCISELTKARREIAKEVAKVNSILHDLSIAGRSVGDDVRIHYAQATELTESAYARLTSCDIALGEVQRFCMTLVEGQLSVFARELRTAADLNHAGEALDLHRIRALCNELLILIDRCPNIAF